MPDDYSGWKLTPAEASPDLSGWKLVSADAPKGVSAMAEKYSAKPQGAGLLARAKDFLTTPDPAWSETDDQMRERAQGLATGMMMPEIPGLRRPLGWLGKKILPGAQALEERLAGRVASRYAKPELDAASSAASTYGNTVQQGRRALQNLTELIGKTGDPAVDAASSGLVNGPEGQTLAKQVAEHTQAKMPGLFGHIDTAKALSDTAADEAKAAFAKGQTTGAAAERLAANAKRSLKEYTVPAVVGAASGAILGGDDNRGSSAITGAALGFAANRQMSKFGRLVTSPETQRLGAAGLRSMAEKMVTFAQTKPQLFGRFGPVLLGAAERGQDALSVTHYALSQDPQYQELQHIASQTEDSP